ncbi:MAG: 2,3-bisphosphoglycerate-independent phosphoglycerate mutase [Peptoniphilaceae bacterium]|nr:2,3-bisphosphoglycerate-independent phosphoglycerate mutase [Peptoniphilaceae bacterium]MDY6086095.1 2,3-bisphosphoglycerate-independent phosphoglycerate mutase [Peptoniphilaceae bacterium]
MDRKIVLIVMDGVGISPEGKEAGDAVKAAQTPTLDDLREHYPWIQLRAHGVAVGLPTDDDMGNSEVGHNALGSGQIYAQGAKLVNQSIADGSLFASETWRNAVDFAKAHDGAMHFIGLLSDGNVHSHIDHLYALIRAAKAAGVSRVFVHALLDGRDVPPTSGGTYLKALDDFFASLNDDTFTGAIASGGGRMKITMDRYKADWEMVKRGWDAQVHGITADGRLFPDAMTAYETLRAETQEVDQNLPAFVIGKNLSRLDDGDEASGIQPIGRIRDGDAVLFYNFRGDRAIEVSMAFEDDDFPYFDRGERPDVFYAGMLEYDGDLHIPSHYLVNPPQIRNTLTEFLVSQGINEFACAETQKFGHVTYFWNGNNSEKVSEELETWLEIPSDNVPFDQRPWMKSAEVTDALIDAIRSGQYGFLRVNYANGDMVGHTGVFRSAEVAIESVDLALSRVVPVALENGYTVLIMADHGNSDDMISVNKKTGAQEPKTSHSLNPVPFIVVSPENDVALDESQSNVAGLANVAATAVALMGLTPPAEWEPSVLA